VQLSSKLWFILSLLLAFVDTSGTPKHVSAEDVELFRQACHISRQVFNFHYVFCSLFFSESSDHSCYTYFAEVALISLNVTVVFLPKCETDVTGRSLLHISGNFIMLNHKLDRDLLRHHMTFAIFTAWPFSVQ